MRDVFYQPTQGCWLVYCKSICPQHISGFDKKWCESTAYYNDGVVGICGSCVWLDLCQCSCDNIIVCSSTVVFCRMKDSKQIGLDDSRTALKHLNFGVWKIESTVIYSDIIQHGALFCFAKSLLPSAFVSQQVFWQNTVPFFFTLPFTSQQNHHEFLPVGLESCFLLTGGHP